MNEQQAQELVRDVRIIKQCLIAILAFLAGVVVKAIFL